jgi:hypothetical protein
VKDASSPVVSDVPIMPVNIVTPTSPKTALPVSQCSTCVLIKDRHPRFLHTRRPTPNNELLLDVRVSDDSVPSPSTPVLSPAAPSASYSAEAVLDRIRLAYASSSGVMRIVQKWAHPGRLAEIDEALVQPCLLILCMKLWELPG